MGLRTGTNSGILAKHIAARGANRTVYSCGCVTLSPWERPLLTQNANASLVVFSSWRLQGELATG